MRRTGFLILFFMVSIEVYAQQNSPVSVKDTSGEVNAELRQRVKKRLYPGGKDEEALQVQIQLTSPTKSGSEEPSEPVSDHD